MSTREVLRYTRIKPPAVIDVQRRARAVPGLAAIVDAPEDEQRGWARAFVAERGVINGGQLAFEYGDYLAIDALPPKRLPSQAAVKDLAAFETVQIRDQASYQADRENLLASVLAFRIVGDVVRAELAGKLLAFVEHVPDVARETTERDYPAVITKRLVFKRPAKPVIPTSIPVADVAKRTELARLAKNLDTLWTIRNDAVRRRTAAIEHEVRGLRKGRPETEIATGKSTRGRIIDLVDQRTKVTSGLALPAMVNLDPTTIGTLVGLNIDIAKLAEDTHKLGAKYGIDLKSFCHAVEKVVEALDEVPGGDVAAIDPACFAESPELDFNDHIRPLGTADLIRIEERLVTYEPGEISYVENVLAGEIRKREIKTTKLFEETVERLTEEIRDTQRDSSITTKQDLSSHVASELSARMSSDVNSSANGSGGGTIGVVDFSGSASVGANLTLGVDTKTSSETTSTFAKEIIDKAVEKTKSTTMERRTTKTSALYETLNSYEINNAGGAEPLNGIYCFLDKRVCLTETVYGKRVFLIANLRLPGRNLLCERKQRVAVSTNELGTRPVFDVVVDQIHPSTYKDLVSRYKASNISPPPPPLQTLTKTYKTDTSNESAEKQEMGFGKFAKELAPFFERYKRFLVTDNVRLPEGYEVRDVVVTVNHGVNGISVSTHLPLQLAGAAMGAASTMLGALITGIVGPAIIIPAGLIQFQYAASPLLHFNTDSGNVTVCVGNQAQDSPYFFFDPMFLMDQLFDALGSILSQSPELLAQVRAAGEELVANLTAATGTFIDGFGTSLQGTITTLVANVQSVLNVFANGLTIDKIKDMAVSFGNITNVSIAAFKDNQLTKDLYKPLTDFIGNVIELFQIGIRNALAELFEFMEGSSHSSQTYEFTSASGMRGELPITLNVIALRPSVTVNVVACLSRTKEALDKWRLQTFESLYQAYLQQLAEWETKAMMRDSAIGLSRNPQSMRDEEAAAVKELVLHAMNNYHSPLGNKYSFDRINFFENAIDWPNVTYRVFNYGPTANQLANDQLGVFAGADDRRRAFLQAAWAQVLIPVQDKADLEQKVINYFQYDTLTLEGTLDEDELAALYQELVRDRAAIGPASKRTLGEIVLPTDLIIVQDKLPSKEQCPPTLPPL